MTSKCSPRVQMCTPSRSSLKMTRGVISSEIQGHRSKTEKKIGPLGVPDSPRKRPMVRLVETDPEGVAMSHREIPGPLPILLERKRGRKVPSREAHALRAKKLVVRTNMISARVRIGAKRTRNAKAERPTMAAQRGMTIPADPLRPRKCLSRGVRAPWGQALECLDPLPKNLNSPVLWWSRRFYPQVYLIHRVNL
jgi:hypothetical protein